MFKRFFALLLALLLLFSLAACQSTPTDGEPQTPEAQEDPAPADYSAVYAALELVPEDLSLYTKTTRRAVETAVGAVRYGLNADAQEEVQAAADAIREAVGALEEKVRFDSYQSIIDYVDAQGIDFDDLAAFDLSGYFEDTILEETEHAGKEYLDETYYIGDSLTLYMHRYATLPRENIFGVGSINPQNAAYDKLVTLMDDKTPATFAEAMAEIKPRRVVLTIGTNSMLMDSIDYISTFGKLIDDIRQGTPETDIIVQSTSPLTADYEKNMKLLTNRNINRSNMLLAGLAAYKGVYFLNTAEALKDENGQLDVKYDLGEGYGHINQAAYEVWEEYLCTHRIPS